MLANLFRDLDLSKFMPKSHKPDLKSLWFILRSLQVGGLKFIHF